MDGNKNQIIDRTLEEQPDYSRLDNLPHDVWKTIRKSRELKRNDVRLPLSFKFTTVVLSLLVFLALSQLSFQPDRYQADIFDLRYFSHESTPSLNIASVSSYGYTP